MSIKDFLFPFLSSVQSFLSRVPILSSLSLPLGSFAPPSRDPESTLVATSPLVACRIHEREVVMGFCWTYAMEIALLSAETKSQLSFSFLGLSFTILIIFLFLFVSLFIGNKFTTAAKVLEKLSVFLLATAVVFTIAIPLAVSLKFAASALYATSLLIVSLRLFF